MQFRCRSHIEHSDYQADWPTLSGSNVKTTEILREVSVICEDRPREFVYTKLPLTLMVNWVAYKRCVYQAEMISFKIGDIQVLEPGSSEGAVSGEFE